MYGVIYKITNKRNGKPYIGQTTRSVEQRFKEHAKSNYLIGKAIRKYGKENFTIEIIEECETPEQLNEREKFWIAFFNCMSPNGYNLTDGGNNAIPSAESCAKMSAAHTGVKRSPETVAKMSESQKGKTLSPEHCEKISQSLQGHPVKPETLEKLIAKNKANANTPEGRALRSAIAIEHWANFLVEQSVYPNLTNELLRQQITVARLAEILKRTPETISKKIRGKVGITPEQKEEIKQFLGVEMSVEELFRRQ